MTAMLTEKRIHGIELRDVETTDSLSMIRATAVPYGVDADIGWFVEQFAPGSLKKSIQEAAAALPLLMFHDSRSWPVGAATKWDHGDDALVGTWRLDGSDEAQRAGQLARDGLLNFMSIGFQPIRNERRSPEDSGLKWNPDLGLKHKDHITRVEARLLETSMVSTPAYKDAAVQWVRAAPPAERMQAAGQVEVAAWRREIDALKG